MVAPQITKFTAEILAPDSGESLGAGFLVSDDGLVATAFHVVEPYFNEGRRVTLRFARATSEQKTAEADYVRPRPWPHDDLILLQVLGNEVELPEPAPLANGEDSYDHAFVTHGYARLGEARTQQVEGKIGLTAEHDNPHAAWLVQLECRGARPGMSGAAVFDKHPDVQAVVGVVVSRPDDDDGLTVHAADARLLVEYLQAIGKAPGAAKPATGRGVVVERVWRLSPNLVDRMDDAPSVFDEYIERRWALQDFREDWNDAAARVLAVTAIGGQGKTSFTRRWLAELPPDSSPARFWWPCYEVAEPDKLLAALYDWLSAGTDNDPPPMGQERALAVMALLNQANAVVVIDGFEVMQHGPGDRYGEVADGDLRALLTGLCRSAGRARVVISSRYPLADLATEPAHRPHPLDRLDAADGVKLLRRYGVSQGTDGALAQLSGRWGGHALTLSLIAAHIRTHCGGAPHAADDIALADGDQYEKLRRVMARYDRGLAEPERRYLMVLGALRRTLPTAGLDKIIKRARAKDDICGPLRGFDLHALRQRLAELGLLRGGEAAPHPLVHEYYRGQLAGQPDAARCRLHRRIADYYQSVAPAPPPEPALPTLEDLAPWVEAVHHRLAADQPDEAFLIVINKIEQAPRFVLDELGAMRPNADLLQGFFSEGSCRLSKGLMRYFCSNWLAIALENLGRTTQALALHQSNLTDIDRGGIAGFDRAVALAHVLRLRVRRGEGGAEEEAPASQHVTPAKAGVHHSGNAPEKVDSGFRRNDDSITVRRSDDADATPPAIAEMLREQIGYLASCNATLERNDRNVLWDAVNGAVLTGDADAVTRLAGLAQRHEVDLFNWTGADSLIPYLEYCRRAGAVPPDWDRAWSATNLPNNKEIICRRSLGDLADDSAEKRLHYDAAVAAARKTSNRLALMGVLNARGRFLARHGETDAARDDLNEAFDYAQNAEYRLEEVNIRIGFAWLYRDENRPDKARVMATRALEMSRRMSYPWGQEDAREVLAALDADAA